MHICADSSESVSCCNEIMSVDSFSRERKRERERERERERVHMNLLFWLVFLESGETQCLGQHLLPMRTHARSQKDLSEGVQLCNSDNVLFSFLGGREDPNITKSWPSSACQRNAI